MYLEIGEIAVPSDLWKDAREGYTEARNKLRSMLSGVQSYSHAFYPGPLREGMEPRDQVEEIICNHPDGWETVTLSELEDSNIIECIKLEVSTE